MTSAFLEIELDELELPKPQIEKFVREMVVAGKIAPRTRVPSTRELAEAWQVPVSTVHMALASLVKDGLLVRHHGSGTYVRQREEKLTCVGVYSGTMYAESLFGQAVQAALKVELHRVGIEPDIWVDPRPDKQLAELWMPMVRAAEHREFQALIVANVGPEQLRWLRKLPVPTSALGGLADMPGWVKIDHPQIADLSLQALAAQGCRSAGLITPANPSARMADGTRSEWLELCERFVELAGELRVTVRNEWMRLVRQNVGLQGARAFEQFGYEEFLKLWRQPERPEGLVVYDDTTARGVMLGLREKQVRVPEDLKLVLHKNEAVDLFCPMPATFLVLSEREIAHHLVAQVQKQFRGESCEPISVPFRLMAHSGQSSK